MHKRSVCGIWHLLRHKDVCNLFHILDPKVVCYHKSHHLSDCLVPIFCSMSVGWKVFIAVTNVQEVMDKS